MKVSLIVATLLFGLLSFTLRKDVPSTEHVETILKQLREHPGQTLGFSASNIYHLYDINIPSDAEIIESSSSYIINPVYITLAVSNSVYDITKQKIPYKMTLFKEYKGSYAIGRKDIAGIEVIWEKKEVSKEFSSALKELKNLANSSLDDLYSPEDDFPDEWKL